MLSGHNTKDALRILHDELKAHLDNFVHKRKGFYISHLATFDHRTRHTIFNWISGLYLTVFSFLLATSFSFQSFRDGWLLAELIILLFFLLVNIAFSLYEEHLKLQEPVNKANKFLLELADCSRKQKWSAENYINLNCPISQCISLQWTIRDSQVINLPCSMLVEGDVILLRPGQNVPARCCSIKNYSREKEHLVTLERDEVFNPPHSFKGLDGSNNLSSCIPLQPQPYILLETPFITTFELFLENSTQKPPGALDKEKYNVYSVFCERKIIPSLLIFLLFVNTLRYLFFKEVVGTWMDMIVVLQIQAVFPLLAVSFPVTWKLLNLFGSTRVLLKFEDLNKAGNSKDLQVNSLKSFRRVVTSFINLLLGESENLPRTSNILQSLGNLTSFCCVDKKGILSWPNPSAEKLFFLTKNKPALKSPDSFIHHNAVNLAQILGKNQKLEESCSTCQVLNLTQDTKNHNGLFFDDFSWKNHISSLKPLGLGILLNTCNLKTTERYTEFADHVKCMSLKQKEAVPVVNRRCFCELARQMGFTDKATDIFSTEDVFGIYQHDTSFAESKELMQREKYKMPMPNVFCVLVKDHSTGTKQLFSQGMADLLLSMCSDYWDGLEIKPLGNSERKKIADFYHRNSMTSYCTAFSYRPFNGDVPLKSAKSFLEVSENLFGSLRHLETRFFPFCFLNGEVRRPSDGGHWEELDSISTMSLQVDGGMVSPKNVPLKYLGNQIFIGMVTMQYQAKQEVVNLIERLEVNCIRFVHFSKENELRSRGFSEKMGLEAGWNCHISLLGENEEIPTGSTSSSLLRQKLQVSGKKSFGSAPMLKVDDGLKIGKLESPEEILMTKSAVHQGTSKSLLVRKPSLNCNVQIGSKAKRQRKKMSNDTEGIHPLIGDQKDEVSPSSSTSSLYSSYIEGLSEIQNRAQLPKGIENIRPHINNIDNVPLQVSLFTDCTTSTTCEMLKILQEFGEVTCCLGSSLNIDNMSMFLRADCSISKDPVLPQICNQQSSYVDPHSGTVGPMQLSAKMNSLSCFLIFKEMDVSCFDKLVSVARAHCQKMRTTAKLFLSMQLCLSCLQLFNCLFFLPPCLSPQLVLWLSVVVVPLLSISMMNNPTFAQVSPGVQGVHQKKVFSQFMKMEVVSFLIRYFPTILICLVIHSVNLFEFCCELNSRQTNSTMCDCHVFFGARNETSTGGDWNGLTSYNALTLSQHFTCLQLVFYLSLISMCNVHRYSYLWKGSPLNNYLWTATALVLISVQAAWFFFAFSSSDGRYSIENISLAGWLMATLWIPFLVCLHELAKKREIRVWIRHQKRAKLDFGTKLGMNSPF